MAGIDKALQIAIRAHEGHTDRAGQPYILHPLRIMAGLNSMTEKIVAVLHDVVEDSDISIADLGEAGFSADIIQAVDALTRRPGEDYFDYIERLSVHPLAVRVKRADLRDNLDGSRLSSFTDRDQARFQKYLTALQMLKDK